MKIITYILLVIVTVGLLGYGAYHWLSGLVTERASEEVSEQLKTSEVNDTARQMVEETPVLRDFVEEGESIDRSEAAFQTQEEAVQVIMRQFSPMELLELRNKAEDGLSAEEQEEIIAKLEENLTEEELRAIKAIAYEELYQ